MRFAQLSKPFRLTFLNSCIELTMEKINAVITGIAGYVPDYILTNDELSKMVDTNDEWIMSHVGIKERHILKEEGLGSGYLGRKACRKLIRETGTNPDDIDLLIVATTTPDYLSSRLIRVNLRSRPQNAFAFDMEAACSGFLYALEIGASFIRSGRYKKVLLVAAEKLSCMVNYNDRNTCPLFGDGAAACFLEPTTEEIGVIDSYLRTDGLGLPSLHMKAGGSVCPPSYFTIDNQMHYIYQDGRPVFKHAVTDMTLACNKVIENNGLTKDDIKWIVPHQANMRIIESVAHMLQIPKEKVLVNIEHYGNTSAVSVPLCLMDYEHILKKGDKLILTTFGAGYSWGAIYLIWGYDGQSRLDKINKAAINK